MRRIPKAEELITQHHFKSTEKDETGVRLFTVTSDSAPFEIHVPEINPDVDVTALMAYVGARTSRSNISYHDAYEEIARLSEKNESIATQRVENIVNGYGHASVADMAVIPLHLNNIPINIAAEIWNMISVGAGQESSTRYIPFDSLKSEPIENLLDLENIPRYEADEISQRYEILTRRMNELYAKWTTKMQEAFNAKFNDGSEKIAGTIRSRSLDIARQWLPMGTYTSMTLFLSARNWGGLIKRLDESPDRDNKILASQLRYALNLPKYGADIKMEIGRFINHTEPTNVVDRNIKSLEKYLLKNTDILEFLDKLPLKKFEVKPSKVELYNITDATFFTAMQYIMRIFPQLSEKQAIKWLHNLPVEKQMKISQLIFKNHDDHETMESMGDLRGVDMLSLDLPMSAARDLVRHRASSRNPDIYYYKHPYELLNRGFVQNFSLFNTKGKGFKELQREWIEDADSLYEELRDLVNVVQKNFPKEDTRWLLRILPLGHMCHLQITSSVAQQLYFSALREKRGGDYEYVNIAQKMIELLKQYRPFAFGMLPKMKPLNPNSLSEFKTRS